MNPLNEVTRKKALKNFIGIYALSVSAIFLMSFLLFKSPAKMSNQHHVELEEQHEALADKTQKLTNHVSRLVSMEQSLIPGQHSNTEEIIAKHKLQLKSQIDSLRSDSANKTFYLFDKDLNSFLSVFDALIFYSQKNYELRQLVQTKNITPENENIYISQLQKHNAGLKKSVDSLKTVVASMERPMNNNDPQANLALQKRLRDLEAEKEKYKTQVTGLMQDVSAKNAEILNKDRQISTYKNQTNQPQNQPSKLTEEEKAKVKYQVVDQVIARRTQSGTKGLYKGLYDILAGIQNTYPDRVQLDKKMKDINALMRDY